MDDPRGQAVPDDVIQRISIFARDLAYGALVSDWPASFQFTVTPRGEGVYSFLGNYDLKFNRYRNKWARQNVDLPHVSLLESWGFVRSAPNNNYTLTPAAFALVKSNLSSAGLPNETNNDNGATADLLRAKVKTSPLEASPAEIDNLAEPDTLTATQRLRAVTAHAPLAAANAPVFIAYSTGESSALALLIEARLRFAGVPTTYMDKTLHGDQRIEQIEGWIKDCRYFVAIVGPQTLESGIVLREIEWAAEAQCAIVSLWHGVAPKAPVKTGLLSGPTDSLTFSIHKAPNYMTQSKGYEILKSRQMINVDGLNAASYESAVNRLLNGFGFQTY